MKERRRRVALALACALLAAAPAAAQLDSIEAEAAVPVPAEAFSAAGLRTKAQEAALREAVIGVAEAIATPPPAAGTATSDATPAASGTTPAAAEGAAPEETAAATARSERVRAAFADIAPLDYMARYRVIQDIGIRPRQRLEDPAVAQEYAVRVEAQVDSARVRKKLAAAGLLPAPPKPLEPTLAPSSFAVVVEGLPSVGALAGVQRALAERSRAKEVLPTTISAREVTFAVTAGQVGADPGAVLRGPAGSALWLEPVPGGEAGAPLRLRVTEPPPLSSEDAERETAPLQAAPGSPPAAPAIPGPSAAPAPPSPARAVPAPGSVPPSAGPAKLAPKPARD